MEALTGLARYAEQQGNTKEAEQYIKKAKSIDPNAAIPQTGGSPAPDGGRECFNTRTKLQTSRSSAPVDHHKSEEAMQLYRAIFKDRPPDGDYALAYYETLAGIPADRTVAATRLHELAKRHPDDQRTRLRRPIS